MIIKPDGKGIAYHSSYPKSDFLNCGGIVIDETKEENKPLVEKILANLPYIDIVIDNGRVADVIVLPKPQQTQPPDLETRLSAVELALLALAGI